MLDAITQNQGKMPEPRRLDLPLLPTGQGERYYLERFMGAFGEEWNGTAVIPAPRAWTADRPDDRPVSDDPGRRARDGEAWFAEAEDAARCGAARAVCPEPLPPGGRMGTHSQGHDGRGRRRASGGSGRASGRVGCASG